MITDAAQGETLLLHPEISNAYESRAGIDHQHIALDERRLPVSAACDEVFHEHQHGYCRLLRLGVQIVQCAGADRAAEEEQADSR